MALNKEQLIAKFEPQRVSLIKATRPLKWIAGVFFALSVLFFIIFLKNGEESNGGLFFVLSLIVGIIFAVIAGRKSKKFKDALTKEIEKDVLDVYFPERKEDMAGMSKDQILYPGFFEVPDRFSSSDYLESSWKGIKFKRSKFKLERREVHHDKNGTRVTYVPYAVGTMFFFDFEREFGQTIKIMEGKHGSFGTKLKKVETEFIEFNKKFTTLASDETTTFYLLTPQMQEKILAIEKLFKGTFNMAFIGSDLWVAINDSFATVNINVKKPITTEDLDKLELYFATPKLIIDNLDLSKDKFKANAGV